MPLLAGTCVSQSCNNSPFHPNIAPMDSNGRPFSAPLRLSFASYVGGWTEPVFLPAGIQRVAIESLGPGPCTPWPGPSPASFPHASVCVAPTPIFIRTQCNGAHSVLPSCSYLIDATHWLQEHRLACSSDHVAACKEASITVVFAVLRGTPLFQGRAALKD